MPQVRPFRAASSPSSSGLNQARPVPGKNGVVPNYRTVIGASYDDQPVSKTIEDDFEDIGAVEKSPTNKRTNFTKQGPML